MEDEIEDIVGDVKLTDSQKSVATSNVYSMDFTDSSPDRHDSSGKDTYVLEIYDSDSSDSNSYPIHEDMTVIDLKGKKNKDVNVQCQVTNVVSKAASTSLDVRKISHACEIYTQTSKTIFEIAQAETNVETLETQTSYVSIKENITYTLEMKRKQFKQFGTNVTVLTNTLEDQSSKFHPSDTDTPKSEENNSVISSDDRIINILDADSNDNVITFDKNHSQYGHTSDFDDSNLSDNSIEQDSLMEVKNRDVMEVSLSEVSDIPKSIDDEIEDLYTKLTESREINARDKAEQEIRHRILTPLTEESIIVRESLLDLTTGSKNTEKSIEESDKDVVFTNFAGGKVKILPKEEVKDFKLPPIQNRSCPNSPQLNFLFSVHPTSKLDNTGTLPCLFEATEIGGLDRWERETKELASGESPLISGKSGLLYSPLPSDPVRSNSIHLPPIHIEGYVVESKISKAEPAPQVLKEASETHPQGTRESISIKEKIKELKMVRSVKSRAQSRTDSRSGSPCSVAESNGSKLCDAAERGCDALCVELIRRLRSSSWYEICATLEEIPTVLDKFWLVMGENRIADLIRQVSAQVESPRTQVCRSACNCLSIILKNTNYTKKPDFNEAVTLLLTKTGSFSRPVRRAANVALDTVVCGVELSHAVTALCVHGVEHKSPLVRCAAARLLVVACALARGGRTLLRARPPSAAHARRHALRALAALLDDRSTDVRRYAERLYTMLRPLANFEAYYLTDVEVERATRQMKKYDRTLSTAAADGR